jgi:predicted glycosyltransferase
VRILIDICHPAHTHFFHWVSDILKQRGHEVLVTSRDKEVTLKLLDEHRWSHRPLSAASTSGSFGLLRELFTRNIALWRVVMEFRPDVMTAIGGIFVAQVGFVSRIPSVVFYDTENAKLQNLLTYPFASVVAVPNCYRGWLPKAHVRYQGYHELSYLHPDYFTPDREIALANGLSSNGETFVLRVVSWKANHDIGETGWSKDLLRQVVGYLGRKGRVIISSEAQLPDDLQSYLYQGNPAEIHHVMAFSRLFVGESATMASECVVLGVIAIYAAHTGRGYCNEQEKRYGLLKNVTKLDVDALIYAIDELLSIPIEETKLRWQTMIDEADDVAEYAVSLILKVGNKRSSKNLNDPQ